jgi:apoptosis-inducing factor 3
MSDDEDDVSLDLTQRIEIERAPDGRILAGTVGEDHVFVWRNGNRLKAYSASCPHLGGPLNKGIVIDGTIRCPWRHACFYMPRGRTPSKLASVQLPGTRCRRQ